MGWELVTIRSEIEMKLTEKYHKSDSKLSTTYKYIFKRELEEKE